MYNEVVSKFFKERNIKCETIKGYESAIGSYCNFHGLSVEELLKEAIKEEEQGIVMRNRKIKYRLIDFRTFLISKNLSTSSVKTYFSKIKTLYKHFEIELPSLPKVKYEKTYESNFYDLPTKKHLSEAIRISQLDMRAVILFMSSSGTAKAETLSLTVEDFIDATDPYHEGDNLSDILSELSCKSDVIPTFYLKRIKTDKYYYTFCSSEATSAIVAYLQSRMNLKPSDSLFDFTDSQLTKNFQKINDKLDWGFVGHYRFFRSHTLRKFHASNIGLSVEDIDALQGRSKNEVHEAYIKTNPDVLKKKYVEAMDNVIIRQPVIEEISDFKIVVNVVIGENTYRID